jgi:hypothetical protein
MGLHPSQLPPVATVPFSADEQRRITRCLRIGDFVSSLIREAFAEGGAFLERLEAWSPEAHRRHAELELRLPEGLDATDLVIRLKRETEGHTRAQFVRHRDGHGTMTLYYGRLLEGDAAVRQRALTATLAATFHESLHTEFEGADFDPSADAPLEERARAALVYLLNPGERVAHAVELAFLYHAERPGERFDEITLRALAEAPERPLGQNAYIYLHASRSPATQARYADLALAGVADEMTAYVRYFHEQLAERGCV